MMGGRLLFAILAAMVVLSGCSALPQPPGPQTTYQIDPPTTDLPRFASTGVASLRVMPATADAAYDTRQMAYEESGYRLGYFAENRWVAPPAVMIRTRLVSALEFSGMVGRVLDGRNGLDGDYRLRLHLSRLQQDFTRTPSEVRLTLRLQLVDSRAGTVVASRGIDLRERADSDDPAGGAIAANRAVERALEQALGFCHSALASTP